MAWYVGRDVIVEAWRPATHATPSMHLTLRPIRVNREVALVTYARLPGREQHRAFALGMPDLLDRDLDSGTREDPPRAPR